MAELSQEELVSKYQVILQKNGIHEAIKKVESNAAELIGENMASTCHYVTVTYLSGRKLELFVKKQPTNLAHVEMLKDLDMFEKEAAFFNILLKDMQAYYMEKSGATKPMDFFPRCFFADDKEIILENLVKEKGYYLNSKLDRQDFESSRFAMQNLAQFHAVGYCMVKAVGRDAFSKKYPCLKENVYFTQSLMYTTTLENCLNITIGILNSNKDKVPAAQKILEILPKYKGKVMESLVSCWDPNGSHIFHVVNHGDCWNNNMLFLKDPDTQKLVHSVLVDFQMCRLASPNMDLSYYLSTSLHTNTRKQHLNQLLRLYFDKLTSTVEQMKVEFPFTFDEFRQDFAAKAPIGFWWNVAFAFGVEILGEIDMGKVEGDVVEFMNKAIMKWLEENPEKSYKQTMDFVERWNEFIELTQGS